MAGANSPDNFQKYRDKRTERFAAGERVKEFQAFKEQAERRLDILEVAVDREDLVLLPSNGFEALSAIAKDSSVSASIDNGGCVLSGRRARNGPSTLKLPIIIREVLHGARPDPPRKICG